MDKNAFITFEFPPIDADSFFQKDPEVLRSFFFKSDEKYDSLKARDAYFLVGTKGSGKTMYAAYMCKCDEDISASRYLVKYEDYKNILDAIDKHIIRESDLKTIWKAILIVKILSCIGKPELENFFGKSKILKTLQALKDTEVIKKLVCDGFSPIEFSESQKMTSTYSADAGANAGAGSAKAAVAETNENSSAFSTKSIEFVDSWRRYVNEVQECLKKVKLTKPVFLFVDGIDIRPQELHYQEYLKTVSALIRASFELNKEVLVAETNFMKITVLTRPDILNKAGLPNLECVLQDNSVVLEWNQFNSVQDIKYTGMYDMINRVLSNIGHEPGESLQNTEKDVWAQDFGFDLIFRSETATRSSFEYSMILSVCRPRNFIKMLIVLQETARTDKEKHLRMKDYFSFDRFQKKYSSYFIQTIRSEMSFEYEQDSITLLMEFLKTFERTRFRYKYFKERMNVFSQKQQLKAYFGDELAILNLIYQLNLICYFEPSGTVRWHYREQSISNLTPSLNSYQIRDDSEFKFHNAVEKELGVYVTKSRLRERRRSFGY